MMPALGSRSKQVTDLSGAARTTVTLLSEATRRARRAPSISIFGQIFVVAACIGLATAVRLLIGQFVPDVIPYATYFPAIAIAALLGGFWPGFATWIISIFAGLFFLLQANGFAGVSASEATSSVLFAFSSALELLIAAMLRDMLWDARRSEARYRALVEASAQLVSIFDAKGACREAQPGWERLTGMAWPAYRDLGWLEAVHPDDRVHVRPGSDVGPSEFEVRIWDKSRNDWRWFNVRGVPILHADGETVQERVGALTDISDRRALQERRELLLGDMRHRLKNFMAVIQALVTAALPKNEPAAAAFARTFLQRVHALQAAGDLVMKANAQDVDLAEVIPAALAPFLGEDERRIAIHGPSLMLKEHTVGGIALACNELATNAAKYGALSTKNGRIDIAWRAAPAGEEERVEFEWRESGGPPVAKPEREGFGSRIIRSAVRNEKDAKVEIDYAPVGLRCEFSFTRTKAAPDAA